jgi:putative PIN family toxin of toxin-antitoxin system
VALIVVFDTNILFSATGWRGNPFRCVEFARLGRVKAFTSPELMQELIEKLELKLGFSPELTSDVLADYLGFIGVVTIPKKLEAVPRDPEDNAVLETAMESKAEFVVTGDDDLLSLKEFRGIRIVRATEFLALMANLPA